MTLYGVERTFRYDPFRLQIAYDSGNEIGLEQRDIHWSEKQSDGKWTEPKFLRSFYFDDVRLNYMQNFCKKFAENSAYRSVCLAGTTDWSVRDALFRRNLGWEYFQERMVIEMLGDEEKTYQFFKKHWQAIVRLPEYQRIQQLDTQFIPSPTILDPEIAPVVYEFNQIPGVKTRFSCQGVSGTVEYEGLDILVVSPHARLGFIWFEALDPANEHRLKNLALSTSSTTYIEFRKSLQSTGDNITFRREALELATALQTSTTL